MIDCVGLYWRKQSKKWESCEQLWGRWSTRQELNDKRYVIYCTELWEVQAEHPLWYEDLIEWLAITSGYTEAVISLDVQLQH